MCSSLAEKWEPQNWRTQLANIRIMREDRSAPVDVEGAAALPDPDSPPNVSTYLAILELLIFWTKKLLSISRK